MKKLIISSVLGVALAASTAFGQGYISFGGGSRTAWDDTGTTPGTDSGFAATFMWAPGTLTSAAVDAIANSTPTNGTLAYQYSAAWSDIESTAGGWAAATDLGTGSNAVALPSNNLGSFSYNTAAAFDLSGTSPGEVISLYAVAWETGGGLYNTLSAAEAANVAVGWGSVFQYTLGSPPPATPPTETSLPQHFGIGATPEPTTLALAGLGGLSMLFLRRKKA